MDLIDGTTYSTLSKISSKHGHKKKQKRKSLLTIPPAEGTATKSTSDNDEPTSTSTNTNTHPSEGPNNNDDLSKKSCHSHCCLTPPGCRGNSIVPKKKLSFLEKLCIGGGHVINDVAAAVWFSYFLIYFQKVNKFSERNAAIIMLMGQVIDACSTPFIGYAEDHYNTGWCCRKGYGRCKSWNLIGAVFILIFFPFMFSPCIGCEDSEQWARVTYYTFIAAVFVIGYSIAELSHFALIPKMTMDPLMRTEILAIRYAFTVMSFITVFLLTWFILGFQDCEITPDKASSFQLLVLISAGIGGIFSLLFHLFIMERTDNEIRRDHHNDVIKARQSLESNVQTCDGRHNLSEKGEGEDETTLSDGTSISTKATGDTSGSGLSKSTISGENYAIDEPQQPPIKALDWLKMKKLYLVAAMYTATRLTVNLTQAYIPLYVHETLHLPCSCIATVPLTMYCSGFIVSIFIKLLNKHLGQLLAYGFGAILCVIGGVLILSVDWKMGIYGVAVLLGGGASAILVTSLAICTDLIGENVESGAFVFGVLSFVDKLSCGVAVMIINEMKMLYTDQGFYRRVLGCIAAGLSIIGTLTVICLTRIIPRKK